MASLSNQESFRLNEELMARRLKNRERQRRYRAKKRLEADVKKAHMIEQQTLIFSVEPQPHPIPLNGITPSSDSTPVGTQTNNPTVNFMSRVYSGRKWKKDARVARASEQPENPSNSENSTSLSARRDWKADARNKMEMASFESSEQKI